ncbi:unknown [Clostridium sp. CAG:1000]|nr:unknown [Clostridium sp. CAG:1000]
MKILSNKRYKKLLEYESKYRLLTGQTVTFCTGERSKYKALLSMEKEEIVRRYFDLHNAYIQLSKKNNRR